MPHLLVAGTTGSGKSVGLNAILLSLLYRFTPRECRLILVDPKVLELKSYDDIPHLLCPVVTEPHKSVRALKWAVEEMEKRYRMMSDIGARNIGGFNERITAAIAKGKPLGRRVQTGFDPDTGEETLRGRAARLRSAAADRADRRRAGRPDGHRRQGDRGADPAPEPEERAPPAST